MSVDGVVVYRTPLEDDARAMGDMLAESGIGSEVRVLPGEDGADAEDREEGSGLERAEALHGLQPQGECEEHAEFAE